MGLFGKKKEIRFETITVERETEVFRALEARGWTLCTDPYQFDLQKSPEKLRKDAMKMAKELDAEIVVEVWDPIYMRMPWKGLKYAAWRRATPEEMQKRIMEKMKRPDYSDSMGDYDKLIQKFDQKQINVQQEEMKGLETQVTAAQPEPEGETYGSAEEDMGMRTEHFDTVSTLNPYDYHGSTDTDLQKPEGGQPPVKKGPYFESSMELQIGTPDSSDPTEAIDPLAMMMDAAAAPEPVQKTPDGPQTPIPPPPVQQTPAATLPQMPPKPPLFAPPPPPPMMQPVKRPEDQQGQ